MKCRAVLPVSCFLQTPAWHSSSFCVCLLLVFLPLSKSFQEAAPSCSVVSTVPVLLCAVKLWEMQKAERGTLWNLHLGELMLMFLIWERQIQVCSTSDRLKRHSCICCNQPNFFQVFVTLIFIFFCPSSLTFPLGFIWNCWSAISAVVCFEILHCAVIITSTFAYLNWFCLLDFLLPVLTRVPLWCLQCDQ